MKPFILTVRAVGCEFAGRSIRVLWLPFAAGAAIVTAITAWLVYLSPWWLLLAVPLWFVILFGIALLMVAHAVVRAFRPPLSSDQRVVVAGFVDKLGRVSEVIGTPAYLLLLKVIRDIVHPRENGFIPQTVSDGTTLHKDFLHVQRMFQ